MPRYLNVSIAFILMGLCLLSGPTAFADVRDGVVQSHAGDDITVRPIAPRSVATEGNWPQLVESTIAGPVLYDLDDDGTLDVIVPAGPYLYAFDDTAGIRDGWPVWGASGNLPVAIGDLDGDGSPDIATAGPRNGLRLDVVAADGTMLPGFPVYLPREFSLDASSPVFADLDGIPGLEVGVASERGISFFHADGSPVAGWPYIWDADLGSFMAQWSAPAVADLDGDGVVEVVVGNQSGRVHVVTGNGLAAPGWPKATAAVLASPALADLDGDGDLEIIVKEGGYITGGNRLFAWHHTGGAVAGWPRTICMNGSSSRGSPAVADVDGDGSLDIVTDTSDGYLHVLDAAGNYLPGWPLLVAENILASPAVIDIDGNGTRELFTTYWTADNHYVGGWYADGSTVAGFPQLLVEGSDYKAHAQVHVADIDGDTILDLAVTSTVGSEGWVHVIPIAGSSAVPGGDEGAWPRFRRDAAAKGVVPLNDVSAVINQPAQAGLELSVAPNPFNPRIIVNFVLPTDGRVEATVYDLRGRHVTTLYSGRQPAGLNELVWDGVAEDGRAAPSGTYFVRLDAGTTTLTEAVTLIR